MSSRRDLILHAALACFAGLLLTPILLLPLNADNDTYQAMAFAMAQGKGLPYLGSWDQNFPAIVFYHWFSIELFGASDLGFRIIDVFNRIVVALLLYRLSLRFVDKRIAWLAVPISSLMYLNSGLWSAGQRDGFALLWLLLALLQVTRNSPLKKQHLFIFGLSIAVASFFRPTNLLFGSLIFFPLRSGRLTIRDMVLTSGTTCLALAILIVPWTLVQNGLSEFFQATIQFNRDVYTGSRATFDSLSESLRLGAPFTIAALFGLLAYLRSGTHRPILLGFAAIACCLIWLQGKFFMYHFEPLTASVIPLILIGIERLSSWSRSYYLLPTGVLIAAFTFLYPRVTLRQFVKWGANWAAYDRIQQNINSSASFSLEDERKVVAYLNANRIASQTEFLLLFPGLRWRSGHPGFSRFTTTYCMTMLAADSLMPYQLLWRKELDSVILTQKPGCLVAAKGPDFVSHLSNITPDSLLRVLPGASALLQSTYRLDTVIGGFNIYRLNEAAN